MRNEYSGEAHAMMRNDEVAGFDLNDFSCGKVDLIFLLMKRNNENVE